MTTLRTLFGGSKTAEELSYQIESVPADQNILITKLPYEIFKGLEGLGYVTAEVSRPNLYPAPSVLPELTYVKSCQSAFLLRDNSLSSLSVAITSAGIADRDVVDEAYLTVALSGYTPIRFDDIGVNDLDKLMAAIPHISKSQAIVSVQGFEGALPVILAGRVDMPIVSVPTSTGYGVSNDGLTALNTSLTSCTSGIASVNINNGFGGACVAIRVLEMLSKALQEAPICI